MSTRNDPLRSFRFFVEIEGIIRGGFSEVTIPDTSSEPIEYRVGEDPPTPRMLVGMIKNGRVVLKRGITNSMALFNWYKDIVNGKIANARKRVYIVIFDELGVNEAARWEFVEAWPTKYDAPDLNAKGNEVAIETLEIAHEGMVRVK